MIYLSIYVLVYIGRITSQSVFRTCQKNMIHGAYIHRGHCFSWDDHEFGDVADG
jgi:hypothetical protein